jgi:hypothetical protein
MKCLTYKVTPPPDSKFRTMYLKLCRTELSQSSQILSSMNNMKTKRVPTKSGRVTTEGDELYYEVRG